MKLTIIGIRGLPAAHGGFETFAEKLALFLVKRGWQVSVYCQEQGNDAPFDSEWNGIELHHIPVAGSGAFSTIVFDLKSIIHAVKFRKNTVCLTLGYNTAIFNFLLRLNNMSNIINMDGIEWKRAKWSPVAKFWFWFNEWCGNFSSTKMIADHPRIQDHLGRLFNAKKIEMIPYGADYVDSFDQQVLDEYQLKFREYAIVIARPEPENSILEIVSSFSLKPRNLKLVVLGNYDKKNEYHRLVVESASDEVLFLGAIYDKYKVSTLRYGALFYAHGHQVGGTNPSLVEALAASNPIVAHDNKFNRWVAGDSALYFSGAADLDQHITHLIESQSLCESLRSNAEKQYRSEFQWDRILCRYEDVLKNSAKGGGAL